ncbi:hypothetical protein BsBEST3125_38190 [Bacillus subtilis]|nr:hypothetical protein BsBEST3125_38190 [Bacillus subtilis]BCV98198.1 hypothetical protein BsBEST3136_38370 [Bacillus subtilis]BCW02479.1 hypothetical protein BsBEST3145_38740 [Bacillus subtilis]BDB95042.1 hypothetical protein BSG8_37940 [Bacillus subtilis subsp. natto]BEH07890.1 hypothetical protein BSNN_39230 [Bacillus subtilis subsp. natto]
MAVYEIGSCVQSAAQVSDPQLRCISETLVKIPLARGGFFCQGNGWAAGNPGNNIKNKTDFTHFKPAELQIMTQPD